MGTKRQARTILEQYVPDVGMHYVTERWLGGTLTNFRTIRARLKRLEELEAIAAEDNFQSYSKKMESQLRREMRKIKRNLDGIRRMEKLPGALVIIDVANEMTAINEARKLGIPTVCLIDTDADPIYADIPIPGNDDSMRSIDVVVREICKAIADGKQNRTESTSAGRDSEAGQGEQGQRQRKGSSRRSMARGEASASASDDAPRNADTVTAPAAE